MSSEEDLVRWCDIDPNMTEIERTEISAQTHNTIDERTEDTPRGTER